MKIHPIEEEEVAAEHEDTTEANLRESVHERIKRFEESDYYQGKTKELLQKIVNQFKTNHDLDATSFINSLKNLAFQHLGN